MHLRVSVPFAFLPAINVSSFCSTSLPVFSVFSVLDFGHSNRYMVVSHFNFHFPNDICWITEKAREFQKNIYFHFIEYTKAFDCVDHNKLWKILKEMGIPDYLTCLLRNLYAGQEATVRTGHGTTDWLQIGKGGCQGCILSPCLFNLYAEYIMRKAGLEEAQLESRLLGEISITSDMQMIPPLWQKVKRN